MIRDRELQTVKAIGLGTILASNLFLFVPFALYIGNPDEFAVSFSTILGLYLRPALFVIAVFALIGTVLTASAFRPYLIFLAAISVLLWFQSNILVWDYGPLDGRRIDWTQSTWRGWVDLGIWLGVVLGAMFFHRRIGKPIIFMAIAISCLQLALSLFAGMQNRSTLLENSGTKASASTLQEIYRFSSHKNVLHLILDGFQSDVFEEIINDGEDGRRFASALEGFVFFKEHMGVFPYTHMSVPAILSGKIYRNHVPANEFIQKTIGGKTILNAAYDAGYEIDLAAPVPLFGMYTMGKYTNAYVIPNHHHVTAREYELSDSAKLFDLSLFRLTPHFLKRYVYNDQLWLVQSLLSDSKYMHLEFFAHNAFLRKWSENMSADRSAPVYKLFHLMLSHQPMVANENCEYAGRVLPIVRATVKIQAKCGLSEVVSLLEKMKELDIYDDAMIVLMGDHGAWVHPTGYAQPDGEPFTSIGPKVVGGAMPLMAIKRPGASGPLRASMAPSSIIDTPVTIASVLGLNEKFDGVSAFDLPPDEFRERRYHVYEYSRGGWTTEYLSTIHEFVVKGSVFDTNTWERGDWYYPKGIVRRRSR